MWLVTSPTKKKAERGNILDKTDRVFWGQAGGDVSTEGPHDAVSFLRTTCQSDRIQHFEQHSSYSTISMFIQKDQPEQIWGQIQAAQCRISATEVVRCRSFNYTNCAKQMLIKHYCMSRFRVRDGDSGGGLRKNRGSFYRVKSWWSHKKRN